MGRSQPTVAESDAPSSLEVGLTAEEDDELRRLNFFQAFGELSPERKERLIELRLRDRRQTVRAPRECLINVEDDPEGGSKGQFRFWRD